MDLTVKHEDNRQINLLQNTKTISTVEKCVLKLHLFHWEVDDRKCICLLFVLTGNNGLDIQYFKLFLIYVDRLTACEVLELHIVCPLLIQSHK